MAGHGDIERAESQPLIPSVSDVHRPLDRADRIDPVDISGLKDAELWRCFQSAKKSAIYHLGWYLDNRDIWERSRPADSAPLDQVPQNAAELPREFCDLKDSHDKLTDELTFLGRLLNTMSERISTQVTASSLLMLSLVIILGRAVFGAAFDTTTAADLPYNIAASMCGCLAFNRLAQARYLRKYTAAIERLDQRAQEDALTESDRHSLDDKKIWWWQTSH